jgi:hypothetical protein
MERVTGPPCQRGGELDVPLFKSTKPWQDISRIYTGYLKDVSLVRTRTFVFAHRPVPCRLKIRQDECRTPDPTATPTTARLSINTRDDMSPNQNLQKMLSEGSQTTLALAHDIVAHTPIQQASNRSRPRPRPKPRVAPLSPMDAGAAIARDCGAVAPIH